MVIESFDNISIQKNVTIIFDFNDPMSRLSQFHGDYIPDRTVSRNVIRVVTVYRPSLLCHGQPLLVFVESVPVI